MLIMSPTWLYAKCKNEEVDTENLCNLSLAVLLQHPAGGPCNAQAILLWRQCHRLMLPHITKAVSLAMEIGVLGF